MVLKRFESNLFGNIGEGQLHIIENNNVLVYGQDKKILIFNLWFIWTQIP